MNYAVNTKEELENFIPTKWTEINQYLDEVGERLPLPIYSSVDVRESLTKFAPVDNNIYPAGFNNVCMLDLLVCSERFKKVINTLNPNTKRVLIIPESHTKNLFYLDHLSTLQKTIEKSGFEVVIGSVDASLFTETDRLELKSMSNWDVSICKVQVIDGCFACGKGVFDVAILNNDQSSPLEIEWDKVKTPVYPTPRIGWFRRQKVSHFCYYKDVVDKFCEKFSINPSILQAKYKTVDGVDFATKDGLEKLGAEVDSLLKDLPADSSVFVKASQGTYGMGISVVQSGEEIISMNRKNRNKMDIGKNKIKFTKVLIQEGVETVIKYNDIPAEVTIYLINGKSVGGFMRANPLKGTQANLNAKGMVYQKYCISEIRDNCEHKAKEAIYSIVARLSTLASAHEIKEVL